MTLGVTLCFGHGLLLSTKNPSMSFPPLTTFPLLSPDSLHLGGALGLHINSPATLFFRCALDLTLCMLCLADLFWGSH